MRRSITIFAMAIVLVAGIVLPAAARDKIAVGMANPVGQKIGAVNNYLAYIGADTHPERTPSFWTLWSQWGERGGNSECYPAEAGTCAFPSGMLNQLDALDISGIIWWQPYDPEQDYPNGQRFARHKETYQNHQNDAYLNSWIDDAKAFGQSHPGRMVYIRLAHEVNGKFFDWRTHNWDNNYKTYKKFWQYVWQKFKNRGALPYVKFIFATPKPEPGLYPGDKYVDYIDPLALNWGGDNWKPLKKVLKKRINKFGNFTNKPIIITELGSAPNGGNKATWIKKGYPKVYQKWSKVKGMVYLDTNQPVFDQGHPDWRLSNAAGGGGGLLLRRHHEVEVPGPHVAPTQQSLTGPGSDYPRSRFGDCTGVRATFWLNSL